MYSPGVEYFWPLRKIVEINDWDFNKYHNIHWKKKENQITKDDVLNMTLKTIKL